MNKKVFKYQSVAESEGRMYNEVKSFLADSGISGKMMYNILLTVSEAFTNALEHGNQYDAAKSIEISIGVDEKAVTAEIIDEGTGDMTSIDSRGRADSLQEGGRGVDLMESIADKINIHKSDRTGGLQISMTFEKGRYINAGWKECNTEEKMEFNRRDEGNTVVIALSGRLDLSNGSKLKEEVKNILTAGKTSIHLNLAHVEFVNSSGLGALVSIMKEIRIHRGRLTLSDLAEYVQEIFDITQLSHIFEIFGTEQEALRSYQVVGCN
ncbi:MAG: anti-sigma factor antagonist [Candidatus Zixiibacteriota bacterium]|nr:MAG: anti-sigma factor antagonist [candidate division Zixibacteria bacterium]